MFMKLETDVLNYMNSHLADYSLILVERESVSKESGDTFYTYEIKMVRSKFVEDSYVKPTKELGDYLNTLLNECDIDSHVARIRSGFSIVVFGESDEHMRKRIEEELNSDNV